MWNIERKIQLNIYSIVNWISAVLVLLLLVYPSYLFTNDSSLILRFALILCASAVIFIVTGCCRKCYDCSSSSGASFEVNYTIGEVVLPGIVALAIIAAHIPFLQTSPGTYCDEMAHVRSAVFGKVAQFQHYHIYILICICVLHFALLIKKVRSLLLRMINTRIIVLIGILIAAAFTILLERYNLSKNTYGIYRFPGMGKIAALYIYAFTNINPYTFRLPSIIFYALSAFPIYYIARECKAGRLFVTLFSFTVLFIPAAFFFMGLMYLEGIWWFFGLCALLFILKAGNSQSSHQRAGFCLLFTFMAICCFFTRNTGLIIPVVVVLSCLLSIVVRGKNSLAEHKPIIFSAAISLIPMIYWHALYTMFGRIEGNLRSYEFSTKAFTYTYGYESYAASIVGTIGIIFSILIVASLIYCTLNIRKGFIYSFAPGLLAAYLLLMFGDFGFPNFYGYARFLLMPLIAVPLLICLMYQKSKEYPKLGILLTILVLATIVESGLKNHLSPAGYVGRYACEVFLPEKETKDIYTSIEKTKDKKIACCGSCEILCHMYQLSRLSVPPQIYNPEGFPYPAAKDIIKYCMENDIDFLWDCEDGGKIVICNDPFYDNTRIAIKSVFDKNNPPEKLQKVESYTGPNNIVFTKYKVLK